MCSRLQLLDQQGNIGILLTLEILDKFFQYRQLTEPRLLKGRDDTLTVGDNSSQEFLDLGLGRQGSELLMSVAPSLRPRNSGSTVTRISATCRPHPKVW